MKKTKNPDRKEARFHVGVGHGYQPGQVVVLSGFGEFQDKTFVVASVTDESVTLDNLRKGFRPRGGG